MLHACTREEQLGAAVHFLLAKKDNAKKAHKKCLKCTVKKNLRQEKPSILVIGFMNSIMDDLALRKRTGPSCSSSVDACNTLAILKRLLLNNYGMLGYILFTL